MVFSQNTTELLQRLESLASKNLSYRNEVGILFELAHQYNKLQTLDDLSFYAKFAHKTFGIMKRIGKHADGYDKLSKEFGESVEKSKNLVNELLALASDETKKEFDTQFLSMSPTAFQNLLALFS
ncbi:MAG: hypothetical protein AAB344_05530, partial [Bacteroidota bacterium]